MPARINPHIPKGEKRTTVVTPKPQDAFTFGRVCPDCDGGLQFKWDRMKFRPKRNVWICPACFDIEKEGLPPINTVGPEDDDAGT